MLSSSLESNLQGAGNVHALWMDMPRAALILAVERVLAVSLCSAPRGRTALHKDSLLGCAR